MKKLLLLLPVGLMALSGLVWIGTGTPETKNHSLSVSTLPSDPKELFSLSEHSLRQIIRHGDQKSLLSLNSSLDALNSSLLKLKNKGLSVSETEHLIALYKQDGIKVTEATTPYLKKLQTYSSIEEAQEKEFVHSLEQIGLYELQKTYENMTKARLTYIKEPSPATQQGYELLLSNTKRIISELYLDTRIEKPLFVYLDNHNLYFKTIVSIYTAAGTERIQRLTDNGYAIKTELQLLPSL
ncbi:MAG: hypothetical protein PHW64_07580 [Sulfuricurvum sp.]|nr:hypothetical protein [Sulfuricurvum sp.]